MRLLTALLFFFSFDSQADFADNLVKAAYSRLQADVTYDGSYVSIAYPNGDVPQNIGVCTDVVIRCYRKVGVDLQQLVHEDMTTSFSEYPSRRIWGLQSTDTNIDHRRVPNLQTFFTRHGKKLPVTQNSNDYKPGDIVTWNLARNLPHIGIVVDKKSTRTGNPLIIHNVGNGPEMEDCLFDYQITGHYRYSPE